MVKAGVNKIYRDLLLAHNLQGMDAHYIAEAGLEDELKRAMATYSAWMGKQHSAPAAQIAAQAKDN